MQFSGVDNYTRFVILPIYPNIKIHHEALALTVVFTKAYFSTITLYDQLLTTQ